MSASESAPNSPGNVDREDLLQRINVSADIIDRFPGFRLGVVFALGIQNGPGNNSVSLAHLMPIGGEDLGQISAHCQLRIASDADRDKDDVDASNVPSPGEVIWSDAIGWTCRRWNWRQGNRTRLTEATQDACFIIEGMASPSFEPDLVAATEDLCERIGEFMNPRQLVTGWIVNPSASKGSPIVSA